MNHWQQTRMHIWISELLLMWPGQPNLNSKMSTWHLNESSAAQVKQTQHPEKFKLSRSNFNTHWESGGHQEYLCHLVPMVFLFQTLPPTMRTCHENIALKSNTCCFHSLLFRKLLKKKGRCLSCLVRKTTKPTSKPKECLLRKSHWHTASSGCQR